MKLIHVLLVALVLFIAPGSIEAQWDDPCSTVAWCHPDGEGMGDGPAGTMATATLSSDCPDPFTCAASRVGDQLDMRVEDCHSSVGLGILQMCVGVALRNLLCAIDGRAITQQACAPPRTPPDSTGTTPPDSTNTGPNDPEPEPTPPPTDDEQQEMRANPVASFGGADLGRALRQHLTRLKIGDRVGQLKVGNRVAFNYILAGRYEMNTRSAAEYFAVIQAQPARGVRGEPVMLVVGGSEPQSNWPTCKRGCTWVMSYDWYMRSLARR